MQESPETSELLTLAAVAEAQSIAKAARILGVPRPTVSRRLARLEGKLGVRLLRRSTRTMALTDAGELLYARARIVLGAVRDAVVSVQKSDNLVRGLLRVSVPPMMGPDVGELIASFLTKYPEVRLEVDASARHVDLVRDGYDVAIRASTDLPPGVIARTLTRTALLAVASPAYIKARGAPTKPSELLKHACIAGFSRGEHPSTEWPLIRGGGTRIEPVLASNDMVVLRAAALAGRGIALLPELLVRHEIAAKSLVPLLTDKVGAQTRVVVMYAERELVPPAVRAFIEATVAWSKRQTTFGS